MSAYHLLFATDKNYLPYLFTTCQSILNAANQAELSGSAQDSVHDLMIFHVLVDESVDQAVADAYVQAFTDFNQERTKQAATGAPEEESVKAKAPVESAVDFKFEFHKVDATAFQSFNQMQRDDWSTVSPYYRLLFAQVIPSDIPRILYLDIDMLILEDLRKLFAQYPMGNEVMCVATTPRAILRSAEPFADVPCLELAPKQEGIEPLKIPVKECFGSGVMLINLEQWRAQNIERQCIETGSKWEMPLFDQDILSAVCVGKISYMDWDWNCQFSLFKMAEIKGWNILNRFVPLAELPVYEGAPNLEQLLTMLKTPKIVHFTELKPWALPYSLSVQDYAWLKDQVPYLMQWVALRKSMQPMFDRVEQLLGITELAASSLSLSVFDSTYAKPHTVAILSPKKPSLSVFDRSYLVLE